MIWRNFSPREKVTLVLLAVLVFALPLVAALVRQRQQRQIEGAPQGASVVINGGVAYTNTREITLSLSPPDTEAFGPRNPAHSPTVKPTIALSPVDRMPTPSSPPTGTMVMQIANNPSFTSAQTENFSPTKAWTLTEGDGEKTVYVRFALQGTQLWTQPISDTIILDTTPPETRIVGGPREGAEVETDSVTFEVSGTDGGGGGGISPTVTSAPTSPITGRPTRPSAPTATSVPTASPTPEIVCLGNIYGSCEQRCAQDGYACLQAYAWPECNDSRGGVTTDCSYSGRSCGCVPK